MGAFNSCFDTVNLHRPTLRPAFVAAAYAASVKMDVWPSMDWMGLVLTVMQGH
jgi:hypothetical protein